MKKSGSMIIAEVGQNHQGELEKALEYIRVYAEHNADVVKFQTRNNRVLFSKDAYGKEYNSENAFAETYGEHREKLELKPEWLPVLKEECHKCNVKFMSTPFDEPSLDLICDVGVDIIKVSSFDLGNLPFLNKIAQKGLPVVISTGGGQSKHVKASVKTLRSGTDDITVMHCVSEYPCTHDRLGLEKILEYSEHFPDCKIGISDHFSGTLSGPVAYMLGARVFEKHVTMNRSWKGTDHSFALEPHGFRNFVRDIHRVPEMMPVKKDDTLGKEYVFKKLGKSLVPSKDLPVGTVLSEDNLTGVIFDEQHIPVRESMKIIGKRIQRNLKAGLPIEYSDLTME